MHRLKFLLAYILPLAAVYGFSANGWHSALPLLIIFVFFPLVELFLPPDSANMDEKMAADAKNETFYDWLLYIAVPVYALTFAYFFVKIAQTPMGSFEFWCRLATMGLICGIFAFNIGHELGHRTKEPIPYFLGQVLLLSVLNLHFIPYHNGGHHRNVGKANDPSTAFKGEWLYTFWFRSQIGGYMQAWRLENGRLRKSGKPIFSLQNEMVRYSLVTVLYLLSLYLVLGANLFAIYLAVVCIGICLLETVNYIEHYGLVREKNERGFYEPVRHHHSWNSDHIFGRVLMFNLSRHSDHHYNGSKKYQLLESLPESPQMPTGYPGMVVLAFFTPLWFFVMHRLLEKNRKIM